MPSIHDVYRPFLLRFRRARMLLLQEQFQLTPSTRVLDVGGTLFNWTLAPVMPTLTLLNVGPRPADLPDHVAYVQGDARQMPSLADNLFDLVYSNSVIEHLGDLESQRRMGAEVRRLGSSYFIQTPDPRFFVEPHLLTPFVHYLPRRACRALLRHGTVWGWLTSPTAEQCDGFMAEVRLVREPELQAIFPDSIIHVERWLGMPKSLIAMKRPATACSGDQGGARPVAAL